MLEDQWLHPESSRRDLTTLETLASWKPSNFHEAFPGMVNGGIQGALLDCHSNWTAAIALMLHGTLQHPPCTVTASFHVKLRKPTPSSETLLLSAKPIEIQKDRVRIFATLGVAEGVTATCEGLFVAVKPGHPAYHRW